MSNLNQVILQGNLTDDPKVMGKEENVARFTVAVNTGFGDYKETAFVDCVAFGKQVEVIAKHFKKGKQIIVSGVLSQNKWEDKDGNARSKLEVRLNRFDGFFFTGNAGDNGAATDTAAEDAPASEAGGDDPDKLF